MNSSSSSFKFWSSFAHELNLCPISGSISLLSVWPAAAPFPLVFPIMVAADAAPVLDAELAPSTL